MVYVVRAIKYSQEQDQVKESSWPQSHPPYQAKSDIKCTGCGHIMIHTMNLNFSSVVQLNEQLMVLQENRKISQRMHDR